MCSGDAVVRCDGAVVLQIPSLKGDYRANWTAGVDQEEDRSNHAAHVTDDLVHVDHGENP